VRGDLAGIRLVIGLGAYEGVLRRAILSLKYSNAAAIGEALGGLLARHVDFEGVLVPVPLHPSRLHKRGYNQAETIARGVRQAMREAARVPPLLVSDALIRTHATAPQSGLDLDARAHNVGGAFRPGAGATLVRDRRVILIDDVLTTGATLRACAAELDRCGAATVDARCAAVKL
jgi:ComF family protein